MKKTLILILILTSNITFCQKKLSLSFCDKSYFLNDKIVNNIFIITNKDTILLPLISKNTYFIDTTVFNVDTADVFFSIGVTNNKSVVYFPITKRILNMTRSIEICISKSKTKYKREVSYNMFVRGEYNYGQAGLISIYKKRKKSILLH